ncbi:hypothetical protein B0F90DRAFT_285864 [Multifurca ochricompacta]|uniref:Uncharacterized protein n=1 Tax=Multifurca ochricompacta TaxID=376703 RepID=A0AAD4LWC7_9AGAM|nr:hypothetical protein B0F90DRAFT_285864 [Multifurca ochricompacta]
MDDSNPMASTASLISTNTTSSSFSPQQKANGKHLPVKKDYAAALSALQSKYGLSDASATSTPAPLSSNKSSTSKHLSTPNNFPSTTPPSSASAASVSAERQRAGRTAKKFSSPLALLRAKYQTRSSLVPSSSSSPLAALGGEQSGRKEDKKIKKADADTVSKHINDGGIYGKVGFT